MAKMLGELLIEKKLITAAQLDEVLSEQQKTSERIGEILIRRKIVSRLLVYKTLAEQRKLKFVLLEKVVINPEALKKISREIVLKFRIMPIDFYKGRLTLATAQPGSFWPESEVLGKNGAHEICTIVSTDEAVDAAIRAHYPGTG